MLDLIILKMRKIRLHLQNIGLYKAIKHIKKATECRRIIANGTAAYGIQYAKTMYCMALELHEKWNLFIADFYISLFRIKI